MRLKGDDSAWPDRVLEMVGHWWCGLFGHDRLTHVDGTRICLRCTECGHQTPGWDTGRPAYRRTYAGDTTRMRLERK